MTNGLLLWVDDEIELLRAHILFLEKKGYEVVTVTNGTDAIEQCAQRTFDLVLLDEMMPGLTGLETLQRIKEINPATPVVMVTYRLKDSRLSHQARQPPPDTPHPQKEHTSARDRDRGDTERLPAELPEPDDADYGLPDARRLAEHLPQAHPLGTGAE